MKKFIIFSAPSGSGKTTIVKTLIEKGLPLGFSVSATSRSPRGGETDGTDYYFITADKFRKHIAEDAFIEYEEVYDNTYYGTLRSEVERINSAGKSVAFDVDVKGGLRLKEIFGEKALSLFIQPPSLEELEKRLRNRKTESEESIARRLNRAGFELSVANKFDVIIINDDLQKAISEAYDTIYSFLNK